MAELKEIVYFLDTLLEADQYDDYAPNGLQVEGKPNIKTLALGVSASLKLFQESEKKSADAVLVHHGLLWNARHLPRIKGIFKNRLKYLLEKEMSLMAYHLPLDGHKKWGNNIMIARRLGLKKTSFFASHGKRKIGIIGQLTNPLSFNAMHKKLNSLFGQVTAQYCYGSQKIRKVAIVSGGAAKDFQEAIDKGADIFITGEYGEPVQEIAREAEKSFISCGHYATERFGLLELEKVLKKKFSIKTVFIDVLNKA